jgi:hypothetical protein
MYISLFAKCLLIICTDCSYVMWEGEDVLAPKRKARHGDCAEVDTELHTFLILVPDGLIIISYMLSHLHSLGRYQRYIWNIWNI